MASEKTEREQALTTKSKKEQAFDIIINKRPTPSDGRRIGFIFD